MNRWLALLTLTTLGCTDGKDTAAEDSDVVLEETEIEDTEVIDAEVIDTDPPRESSVVTVPASAEAEQAGASMDFGVYSRYQQLVPGSMVSAVAVEILELRLRRTPGKGSDGRTTSLPSVELWLGTAAAEDLSSTFADNLTGDEQQVFSEAVNLAAASGDPLLFDDLVVTVDPPFAYDPAQGGLLVDLRIPTTGDNVLFDCKNDGSMPVVMSSAAGTPTESNNLSGCGMALQLVVR
jgi:hypothetical protein